MKSSARVHMEIIGQELSAAENEQQKRESGEMRESSEDRVVFEGQPLPKRGLKGKYPQLGYSRQLISRW